jgi:hypothetical protein
MKNKNLDPYIMGTILFALLLALYPINFIISLIIVFSLWIVGAISMAKGKRLIYFWWGLLLSFILMCILIGSAYILWN